MSTIRSSDQTNHKSVRRKCRESQRKLYDDFVAGVRAFLQAKEDPEHCTFANDILGTHQVNHCLSSILSHVYIEEVRTYLDEQLDRVLDDFFTGIHNYSQLQSAEKYIELLDLSGRQADTHIRGLHAIPLDDHEMRHNQRKLESYFFGVVYTKRKIFWVQLGEQFFRLCLKNDNIFKDKIEKALKNMADIGIINESFTIAVSIMQELIEKKINEHKGVYNKKSLDECMLWLSDWFSSKLIRQLVYRFNISQRSSEQFYENPEHVLENTLLTKFHEMRSEELFDIIKAFAAGEDVYCAIEDIKRCTSGLAQRENIKKCLIRNFKSRLLHSSVGTGGILIYLVSLKAVLDTIDPTSYILNCVVEPVRRYLRWRRDISKCILKMLLSKENQIGCVNRHRPDAEAEGIMELETWVPESIVAVGTVEERRTDTLEFLMKILEAPESLFDEYAVHMSLVLLSKKTMDTTQECIELEFLMTLFGEANFINCKTMLMDMSNSYCLSVTYAGDYRDHMPSNINIIPITYTYYSWPPLNNFPICLPPILEFARQSYDNWFTNGRSNRYLVWLFGNGIMELELYFDDHVQSFWVPEIEGFVIMHFDNVKCLSLQTIFRKLVSEQPQLPKLNRLNPISQSALLLRISNALNEWVTRGVLTQTKPNIYSVKHMLSQSNSPITENTQEDALLLGTESPSKSYNLRLESHHKDDDVQQSGNMPQSDDVLKSIIIGMLTNQGPSTIEQIHNRMTMFLQYSKPISSLRSFLNTLHVKGIISRNINEAFYI